MRRLLNTLFVTTENAYLCREGENVVVRADGEDKLRLPVHTLGSVVCFGHVMVSPPLMELCAERGVAISFLSTHGRFYARVEGPVSGNVLLRREQYRRADDETASAQIASTIVIAKIINARNVLLRAARDHSETTNVSALETAAARLFQIMDPVRTPASLEAVRGCEGEAAQAYFGVFDHLITAQKDGFFFHQRSRRPPLDNMNALLSFLYTLLVHDVAAALESVGLDPQVGFLHTDRPGRPSLALDLMEEFRACFADRLALSLVNRQQLRAADFQKTESGAVTMNDSARKELLVAYQKRKQEEITHPFLEESVPVGLLPHLQARLLARHLRGDLDAYPPFIWK